MINLRISRPITVYGKVTRGHGGHDLRFPARPPLQVTSLARWPPPTRVTPHLDPLDGSVSRYSFLYQRQPSVASTRALTSTSKPFPAATAVYFPANVQFSQVSTAQSPFLGRKTRINCKI